MTNLLRQAKQELVEVREQRRELARQEARLERVIALLGEETSNGRARAPQGSPVIAADLQPGDWDKLPVRAQRMDQDGAPGRALRALEQHGPLTNMELAGAAGLGTGTVSYALMRLRCSGDARPVGRKGRGVRGLKWEAVPREARFKPGQQEPVRA